MKRRVNIKDNADQKRKRFLSKKVLNYFTIKNMNGYIFLFFFLSFYLNL